jgi:hypothetical protein
MPWTNTVAYVISSSIIMNGMAIRRKIKLAPLQPGLIFYVKTQTNRVKLLSFQVLPFIVGSWLFLQILE